MMQEESDDSDLSKSLEDKLELDLSVINIETELQCFEGEGVNFIECDDQPFKSEITFILTSMEESTSDSIKIHTSSQEIEPECRAECEEILSILKKERTRLTRSTPIISINKDSAISLTKSTPLTPFIPKACSNAEITVHRPVPKRKTVSK